MNTRQEYKPENYANHSGDNVHHAAPLAFGNPNSSDYETCDRNKETEGDQYRVHGIFFSNCHKHFSLYMPQVHRRILSPVSRIGGES